MKIEELNKIESVLKEYGIRFKGKGKIKKNDLYKNE